MNGIKSIKTDSLYFGKNIFNGNIEFTAYLKANEKIENFHIILNEKGK